MFRNMYVRFISSFASSLQTLGHKAVEKGEKWNAEIYDKHREILHKIYPE